MVVATILPNDGQDDPAVVTTCKGMCDVPTVASWLLLEMVRCSFYIEMT
jgi:hypothetical protein